MQWPTAFANNTHQHCQRFVTLSVAEFKWNFGCGQNIKYNVTTLIWLYGEGLEKKNTARLYYKIIQNIFSTCISTTNLSQPTQAVYRDNFVTKHFAKLSLFVYEYQIIANSKAKNLNYLKHLIIAENQIAQITFRLKSINQFFFVAES